MRGFPVRPRLSLGIRQVEIRAETLQSGVYFEFAPASCQDDLATSESDHRSPKQTRVKSRERPRLIRPNFTFIFTRTVSGHMSKTASCSVS